MNTRVTCSTSIRFSVLSVSIRFGGVTTVRIRPKSLYRNQPFKTIIQQFISHSVAFNVAYTNGKMSSRLPAAVRQTCTVSEQFRAVGTTPARQTYPETGRESPRDRIVTSLCLCEAIDEVLSSSMVALQPRA